MINGAAHSLPETGFHQFGLGFADESGDSMLSWDEFSSRFGRLDHDATSPSPTGVSLVAWLLGFTSLRVVIIRLPR
jgi:hypothetical protein